MLDILVLYYSRYGATRKLAESVAHGVESVAGANARLRTVPEVTAVVEALAAAVPESGPPYVEARDLRECAGLALGSPTRFGNMAAPLKHFIDSTGAEWVSGSLAGKPACVFTSTGSLHGGQETTLITMMLPLLHHGMFIMGLPYPGTELMSAPAGGTPYGASHHAGPDNRLPVQDSELQLARILGQRLARAALKLAT